MTSKTMAVASVVCFCMSVHAVQRTLQTVDSTYQVLTKAGNWTGGVSPEADTEDDYLLSYKNGVDIRLPNSSATFNCHSFTIGTDQICPKLYQNASSGMTFVKDGLKLVNGSWTTWSTLAYCIQGPVTFMRTVGATFSGAQGNVAWEFSGSVGTLNQTSGFVLKGTSSTEGTFHGMRFSGDLSGFTGCMQLEGKARLEIGNALSSMDMPGTIRVTAAPAVLAHTTTGKGFSLGSFETKYPTTLEIPLNFQESSCPLLAITSTFSIDDRLILSVSEPGWTTADSTVREYKIIEAPVSAGLHASQFVVQSKDNFTAAHYLVEVRHEESQDVVYLKSLPVASFVSQSGHNLITDPVDWNPAGSPRNGWSYYATTGTPRTPNESTPYVFPGVKLSFLGTGTREIVMQGYDNAFSNFVVGANLKMYNWHEGDKTQPQGAVSGTRTQRGNVLIDGSCTLTLMSTVPVCYCLAADISGYGTLSLIEQDNPLANGNFMVDVAGDNSEFHGKVIAATRASSFEHGIVLRVHNSLSLGGSLASADAAAVSIGPNVTLYACESTRIDVANRGIRFENSALETPNGVSFDLAVPTTYAGTLTKMGPGVLTLSGECHVESAVTPALVVNEGCVKAGSTDAFMGLSVSFRNNAKLLAPVKDDIAGDVAIYGLKNVVSETPILIETTDSRLHVMVDGNDVKPGAVVPILTVSENAATSLRGKIVIDKPGRGLRGVVSEKCVDPNTVTFFGRVESTGLILIFE